MHEGGMHSVSTRVSVSAMGWMLVNVTVCGAVDALQCLTWCLLRPGGAGSDTHVAWEQ